MVSASPVVVTVLTTVTAKRDRINITRISAPRVFVQALCRPAAPRKSP